MFFQTRLSKLLTGITGVGLAIWIAACVFGAIAYAVLAGTAERIAAWIAGPQAEPAVCFPPSAKIYRFERRKSAGRRNAA